MERKIGEIFEFNGKWYQCLIGNRCSKCDFSSNNITCDIHGTLICTCKGRSDETSVVFKKLEKVGEPYILENKKFQKYKVFKTPYIYNKIDCSWQSFADPYYVSLEIKQNKEDMEEKKLNLKPFDIQKAKEGKPVCTRDGRKARIICFDTKGDVCPIIALVEENGIEAAYHYDKNGRNAYNKSGLDLMMLYEKKEGYINVYSTMIYDTLEAADKAMRDINSNHYIQTLKVEWEE